MSETSLHEAIPLPTEVLAIRAARDFCAANHMRGATVAELDRYIARLRKAFLESPAPSTVPVNE